MGTDIRGSFARISRPKTSVRAVKIWKNKHFGADIHDPKARTSMTLRDFQKLRSEKLWAESSFPKNGPKNDPKLPRKLLSLVLLCRISHRHYSKIFHREFPRKIKYFFTTRICRHGHAKIFILKVFPLSVRFPQRTPFNEILS